MSVVAGGRAALGIPLVLACVTAAAAEYGAREAAETSVAATGYWYAMRDQPDFGVGVATLDRGALHLEARYNYEVRDAGSAFVGWKFAGGNVVTFEVTPIIGGLFGAARGVVPGFEASVAYETLDFYIEAEYVRDSRGASESYYYAWSEIGWKPVSWLRVGLAGQRTREVENGRDLQRGAFVQFIIDRLTAGFYAFNPDSGARYVIVSIGARF